MLSHYSEGRYAECQYAEYSKAECSYAKCCYAESRGIFQRVGGCLMMIEVTHFPEFGFSKFLQILEEFFISKRNLKPGNTN